MPVLLTPRTLPLPRRDLLAWLLALGVPVGSAASEVASFLRTCRCVLLLRHAATDPGIGDPPNFKLAVCSTQRNLSPTGRADAKRIGAWFSQRGLAPSQVRSSAWCRCQETAQLAFGKAELWSPLNSVFGDRLPLPDQTDQLRAALSQLAPGGFEVWVTHQVNVTALTGQSPAMGEGFVVDQQAKVLSRLVFS